DRVGCWLATVIFVGFNVTFLPQFVMGTNGMHRRYFDYDPEFTLNHQISSVGAFVMGIALFLMFVNLFRSIKHGRKAPDNPWGGTTLEWQAPTPPTLYNFPENEPPPTLYEIYDYSDLEYVSEEEGWVRRSEQKGKAAAKADAPKQDEAKEVEAKADKAEAKAAEAEEAEEAEKTAKDESADKAEETADDEKAEKSADDGEAEKAEASDESEDDEKAEADSDDEKKDD
ncbi:MAG: hypothetical protein KJO07_09355, partial [Deltaproteobacteria bacterium]|nr:hypothetical protein [Deltaproteobacteria bacterium]